MLCYAIVSCDDLSEKDFKSFSTDFVSAYLQLFPDETPLSKDNENLALLALPTSVYFDSLRQFHENMSTELQQFDVNNNAFPYKSEAQKIENILKNIDSYLGDYQTNPIHYNVFYGFNRILTSNYASDEYKLQTIFRKLDGVTAFYEAAKSQLVKADRSLADACVVQHVQTFRFFDETLPNYLNTRHLMTPQYVTRLEEAKLAIKDYVAYVESFKVKD